MESVVSANEPLFWADRDPHLYGVVNEGPVIRFQEHRLPGPRRIGIIVCLLFAILPVAFSIAMVGELFQEASPGVIQTVEEGCGEFHVESGELLPGKLYCVPSSGPEVISLESLEVSDDQHIRERFGTEDVYEYRWEAVDDYVVFGEIFDGKYECMTLLPQNNLGDDWTYADLSIRAGQYNPDWCGSDVDDSARNYSSDEPHPYDGIWLYDVEYGDPMNRLSMVKFDGLDVLLQEGETEVYMRDGGAPADAEGFSGLLCITVPISLLFLAGADPRKRALYFHVDAGKIVRRRVGRWPSFQTTWADVDFSSASLQRTVRIQEHVEHDENGPGRRWTTQHPGFDLRISRKNGPIIPVFFDDGGNLMLHESTILRLLKGLNLGEEHFHSHMKEAPEQQSAIKGASPAQMDDEDANAPVVAPSEGDSGAFWNIGQGKNP